MNNFYTIQARDMHFISDSINGISNGELTAHRERDNSGRVINTRQSNSTASEFEMSRKTKVYLCMRNNTTKLIGLCAFGLTATVGGAVLIVLHFASPNQDGFLIPALSLFIAGIAVTSVGDWYCRTKLGQRQRHEGRRQRTQQINIERVTDGEENPQFCDLPPSYVAYADYAVHQLPTTSNCSNGNNITFVAETSSNRSDPEDELPPYNALTMYSEDTLPSYQEVIKTNAQINSAGS